MFTRFRRSVQQRYERYQRRSDPSLPDKCDTCGLRIEYFTDPHFDATTTKVAELDKLGLARYAPRTILFSNVQNLPASFCALANTRYWRQNHLPCPDWQMKLPGNSVSLSDHLSIHHTRVSMRQATKLQWIVIAVAVVALLLSVSAIWLAHKDATTATQLRSQLK